MLKKALIAEGRMMGMPSMEKYISALDSAGLSKLLMEIYAGVARKPVEHPDLKDFFKAKFWI